MKQFYTVKDVMRILQVKEAKAYKIIRKLNEELMETVATDNIPEVDKEKINDLIQQLADMIWKYSD